MSGGLFALFDDVAALAKVAAASMDDVAAGAGRASAKAAGVVVDDTAVTPQFMTGSPADRELPIIKKIAIGSLRNKLLFILPAALLLSQFADWALPILLILGGTYLSYEGAEKIWERISGHGHDAEDELAATGEFTQEHEDRTVTNAVRTDFILSAEIMVIALNEVADESFWSRLVILAAVAVVITLLVYGVVAVIVKMDDVGLHLAQRASQAAQKVGRALVSAMPRVLATISVIGTAAMLWVGGHILLTSTHELGWHAPYDAVHHLEEQVHGGAVGWLVNTGVSAVVGLVVGAVVVAAMHLRPRRTADPAP